MQKSAVKRILKHILVLGVPALILLIIFAWPALSKPSSGDYSTVPMDVPIDELIERINAASAYEVTDLADSYIREDGKQVEAYRYGDNALLHFVMDGVTTVDNIQFFLPREEPNVCRDMLFSLCAALEDKSAAQAVCERLDESSDALHQGESVTYLSEELFYFALIKDIAETPSLCGSISRYEVQ